MGSVICTSNLGCYLSGSGVDQIRHLHVWSSAGIEARRVGPKCVAVARHSGQRCQCNPVRGGRFCVRHTRGADRRASDVVLEKHHREMLEGGNPVRVERALRGLSKIAARRLRQLWGTEGSLTGDPDFPGSTLSLDDYCERKIRDWLLHECGVDLDATRLPDTGHHHTARAVDRMRHIAWRVYKRRNNRDPEFEALMRGRVKWVLHYDRQWWAHYDATYGPDDSPA
jgi:hypothetical protein